LDTDSRLCVLSQHRGRYSAWLRSNNKTHIQLMAVYGSFFIAKYIHMITNCPYFEREDYNEILQSTVK